ncbi:MAG: hypothetical protein ACRD1C_07960, partial [Terriglobales bacterium]
MEQAKGPLAGGTGISITNISTGWGDGNIASQTATTELLGTQPLYSLQTTDFDEYGRVTASSTTDWGTSPSGGPLLSSAASTWSLDSYGADLERNQTVTGYDPNAETDAQTSWAYNSIGEVTGVTRQTGATPLTASYTYNANGTLASVTEPNGAVTTYSNFTCGNGLFPQNTSYGGLLTSAASWNCTGGVQTGETDANGNTTSSAYGGPGNTWLPSATTIPGPYTINYAYSFPAGSPSSVESSMVFGGAITDTLTATDGLGRAVLVQHRQTPTSSDYDSIETEYDAMGRISAVSVPYTAAAGVLGGASWTTITHDELSRPLVVTNPAGGSMTYAYSLNDALVTESGSPNVVKQDQFDGLGRLQSVCAVTGAGADGQCEQTGGGQGYFTSYVRNARGQILQVTQGAQTRLFGFDELGRMTAENNPESGYTRYTFDTDPTCGTSEGDLVKRVDANGNVTCYGYDTLHRVTAVSYPSGPNAAATPTKGFLWDNAGSSGITTAPGYNPANSKGRVVEAWTGPANAPDSIVGFGYDLMGRRNYTAQEIGGAAWTVASESYFPNGTVATLNAPGVPAISYGVDGEGRPTTVSAASGQNPVTAAQWTAQGLISLALGSGDSDAYEYDAAGRMNSYVFTVGGATDTGRIGWNTNNSIASLAITDNIPGATDNGLNCTYTRNNLGSLAGASCGTYDETFSWDGFGNHNSGGTPVGLQTNFSFSGNRISGGNYDNDGNLLQDPLLPQNTNTFDADGHAVSFWAATVVYGALGREIQAGVSGSWGPDSVLYAPDGSKLGLMNGSTVVDMDIPLPGGGAAYYGASGLQFYR